MDGGAGASRRRPWLDVLVATGLVAPLLAAALAGSHHAQTLKLNLGPGDSPYVSGFLPLYEVEDKVGTHWTTYDAMVGLPLTLRGGRLELSYRFARVFPQTAVVEVFFGGQRVDRFECRGGLVQERRVRVEASSPVAATVTLHVDSHDRRNMGLKMDWLRIDAAEGGTVRLEGGARWRPALLVLVLYLVLRGAGWGRPWAAALAAPWSLAVLLGLLFRPWLTHRLLTGVPEALAALGALGLIVGRGLSARGLARPRDVQLLVALASTAFLVRGAGMNHPDFYYPDLMTHARLVDLLRETGPRFLLSPSAYLEQHGAWSKPAYGGTSGLPYAPTFHAPFAILPLSYDATLTAFKLTGAAVTTIPLVLLLALARRIGASALGALLMLFIPTYTSRLSFALLPALLGHAADMALVLWLCCRLERVRSPRAWMAGVALLAACELTYVSSVVNLGLLLGVLALLASVERREDRLRRALLILGMGLAGSAIAVLVFYRDFLGTAWDLAARILSRGTGGTTRYPVEGWLALAFGRTRDFFDGVYPVLAAVGLVLLVRRGKARSLLIAWVATYLLLLLLRAKIPDVFRYGHETLLLTPLVCLTAGESLAWLGSRGLWGRLLAGALLVFLAVQGAALQWRALADQLGNAL